METGATESSSSDNCPNQMEENRETASDKTRNILCNMFVAVNSLYHLKDGLYTAVLKETPGDGMYKFILCSIICTLFLQDLSLTSHVHFSFFLGSCRQKSLIELPSEVKNLRLELSDLHLKHKSLARELQSRQDTDAKNKAELKRLRGNFFFFFLCFI